MRHRHRLPGVWRAGLAHRADDADLRSERSGQAAIHPRLRTTWPAAGGVGTTPDGLHGAISMGPSGNRVYFGYGTAAGGVVQIVDRRSSSTVRRNRPARICCCRRSAGSICHRMSAHIPCSRCCDWRFPEFGRHTESANARLRRHHQRIDRQRMPRSAGRWCGSPISPPSRSRLVCRTGPSLKPAAISADAVAASARIPRTRTGRSSTTSG